MRKRSTKILNIMISFGYFLLFTGIVLFFAAEGSELLNNLCSAVLILQLIVSFCIHYLNLRENHSAYKMFVAFFLFLWAVLTLVILNLKEVSFYQIWPLYGFFPALALLVCGHYHFKKFKIKYTLPAFMILVMSLWYLPFSLKISELSFRFVSYYAGPLLTAGFVVLFVLFYFLQKKNSNLVIKEDESVEIMEDDDFIRPDC